ncbi:TetR/AcrR family transcriptional regulator [Fructobacillus durionis]|uniref:Transcriptional regulator, TetR family n=1 Tax=Fructobacillus durionis TaxID=283737 RepID=A0A1I1DVD1_9LACO|nr:TetR/AcrR family transcriptional regulator [Fructobacillus durionis]SFB78362.1 transcriptional regulator, TetR family [Fructobacillus durionis]
MTEKKIKRTDQVNQSIDMLLGGLTKLMQDKPIDKITIGELTDTAGLSRRTFYRHFQTVDDLLTLKVSRLVDRLYGTMDPSHMTFEKVLNSCYETLKPDKAFLLALAKNQREYLLQKVILEKRDESIIQVPHDPIHDLTAYFGAGGMSSIIIYWIHQGFSQSNEEVAQANHELIQHIKRIAQ